jgi:hypothetical protein
MNEEVIRASSFEELLTGLLQFLENEKWFPQNSNELKLAEAKGETMSDLLRVN